MAEAARRQSAAEAFVGVIYVRKNTLPVGRCIDNLEMIAKINAPEDHANQVVYLPL